MPKNRMVITNMERKIRNFNVHLIVITKGYEKEVVCNSLAPRQLIKNCCNIGMS